MLSDIVASPAKRIPVAGGDVLHVLKAGDQQFAGFGEVYISLIQHGVIKGWKKHSRMILNLVVPVGEVRFVFHDPDSGEFLSHTIGESNYRRLTVPPGIWFRFEGVAEKESMVVNVASIEHDPDEATSRSLSDFPEPGFCS